MGRKFLTQSINLFLLWINAERDESSSEIGYVCDITCWLITVQTTQKQVRQWDWPIKVDYCSSVLSGISGQLSQRLQFVFNASARLVYSARKSEHITPLLRELHWLQVPERIQFRLCVFVYRCLNGTAPSYLAETLYTIADLGSRQRLRSAFTSTLVIPSTRRTTIRYDTVDLHALKSYEMASLI